MSTEQFKAVLAELANTDLTTGDQIKTGPFMVSGNTDTSQRPWLLPVSIDDRGRLWIERNGVMTCVLDTRGLHSREFSKFGITDRLA